VSAPDWYVPRYTWDDCGPWNSDGHVAYRGAIDGADAKAMPHAPGYDAEKSVPVALGPENEAGVRPCGDTYVAAHFVARAERLFPGVAWRHAGGLAPLLGFVGDTMVAMVMPVRWSPMTGSCHPKCPTCEGHGGPKCEACEGSGEAECSKCGHETECNDCDGSGRVGKCADCNGSGKWVAPTDATPKP
jgi:hypothetical protein